jgi:hypothetical protein
MIFKLRSIYIIFCLLIIFCYILITNFNIIITYINICIFIIKTYLYTLYTNEPYINEVPVNEF